jgi:hypothetical protein
MGLRPVVSLIGLLVALTGQAAADGGPLHPGPEWAAEWIVAPGTDVDGYGVYHFRRTFELASVPAAFPVHVTADNRYQLLVNGRRVAAGPARGQLGHWRYDTVELASHLRPGRNVVAAVVWNFGPHAPMAQVSWRTGFLLEGGTPAASVLNTGPAWKALRNDAYRPLIYTQAQMRGLFIVGPGDRVDGSRYPWDWEQPGFDDQTWPAAAPLLSGRRTPGRSRPTEGAAPAG